MTACDWYVIGRLNPTSTEDSCYLIAGEAIRFGGTFAAVRMHTYTYVYMYIVYCGPADLTTCRDHELSLLFLFVWGSQRKPCAGVPCTLYGGDPDFAVDRDTLMYVRVYVC